MKLYLASYSTDKKIFEVKDAKNLLDTYLLFKNKDYVFWHQQKGLVGKNLFLDSGAYSAFSRGEKIDIDKYIEFVKKYKSHIEVYAGLDVIGDHIGTRKNIEYMESKGLKPLPTFHFGSPLEELERMINKYDYIALGGLVPLSMQRTKLKKWLDTCFSVIVKKKPLTKVHGFGVNAFWAWERYPFYSVDATSWLMGGKFRRVVVFEKGKFIAYNKRNNEKNLKTLSTHNNHYTDLNRNNVKEYLKGADYITELWIKRGIKWN